MIEFQKASIEDVPVIIETRRKAWDATYRGIYPDHVIDDFDYEWHGQMERKRLENPDFHCFTVMDHKNCVGYFSYGKVRSGAWKDFGFRLHSLYLLPEYQKKGLGKRIFTQVSDACKALGFRKMYLDCHPQNQNALMFYQHMGGMITHMDSGHENPQEDCCTIEYNFNKGE